MMLLPLMWLYDNPSRTSNLRVVCAFFSNLTLSCLCSTYILTGCSSLKWAIDTRLVLPLPWIGIYFHLYSNDITVTTIDLRVKHNIGSICRNLRLCDVILHLLLFYKSKSHILSIVNVCLSFTQNFDTVPQMVSEIWLKTYTKNSSFSMLCCCT